MIRTHTKIFNYLSLWLHNGFIEKGDLKEISVELAAILKPQKKAHPLFGPMNELYQKYAELYNKEVLWSGRTGKAMNEIIFKLIALVSKKNPNFKDEDILNSFELILQNLPEFYKNSYDIISLNNKIDVIINQIKSDRSKHEPINTSAATEYLANLRSGGKNGQ